MCAQAERSYQTEWVRWVIPCVCNLWAHCEVSGVVTAWRSGFKATRHRRTWRKWRESVYCLEHEVGLSNWLTYKSSHILSGNDAGLTASLQYGLLFELGTQYVSFQTELGLHFTITNQLLRDSTFVKKQNIAYASEKQMKFWLISAFITNRNSLGTQCIHVHSTRSSTAVGTFFVCSATDMLSTFLPVDASLMSGFHFKYSHCSCGKAVTNKSCLVSYETSCLAEQTQSIP